MKIYFEDGTLQSNISAQTPFLGSNSCYRIDAKDGVSACINTAEYLRYCNNQNIEIYTNCLELFSNIYAWNYKFKVPEVYIRHKDSGEFVRIDNATNRELREHHNLAKMYLAGEFDSITNALDNRPVIALPVVEIDR